MILPPALAIDELLAFLNRWPTAGLATVDEHGRPHAANVWFAADQQLCLYFVSSPHSAHARHIARRGDVAVTIYAQVDDPAQIHGLQLHGQCHALALGAERQEGMAVYLARFPFAATGSLRDRIERETLFRVRPLWCRYLDNRRGFGFKLEWNG